MNIIKSKSLASIIMMMVAIGVLIIPAAATYNIENYYTDHIIAVEGMYTSGTDILVNEPITQADVLSYAGGQVYGGDINNDSALIRYHSGFPPTEIYFGDYVTYLGNGTYTITPDYTDNPDETVTTNLLIELDITPGELATFDFARITHNDDDQHYYIVMKDNIVNTVYYLGLTPTTNTTAVFIPTIYTKSTLNKSSESTVYLAIGHRQGNLDLVGEPVSIDFGIEGFELQGSDVLTWSDESVYIISILICDFILFSALLFSTDAVDIAWDKPKRKSRR